jgi:hypothetical protein
LGGALIVADTGLPKTLGAVTCIVVPPTFIILKYRLKSDRKTYLFFF